MTEDIMLGIIRKADELGQDEIVVASDEIERLRARIAELERYLKTEQTGASLQAERVEHQASRIAELEAENAKFRAMYDEQLLMAVKVSAALEKKND